MKSFSRIFSRLTALLLTVLLCMIPFYAEETEAETTEAETTEAESAESESAESESAESESIAEESSAETTEGSAEESEPEESEPEETEPEESEAEDELEEGETIASAETEPEEPTEESEEEETTEKETTEPVTTPKPVVITRPRQDVEAGAITVESVSRSDEIPSLPTESVQQTEAATIPAEDPEPDEEDASAESTFGQEQITADPSTSEEESQPSQDSDSPKPMLTPLHIVLAIIGICAVTAVMVFYYRGGHEE